MDGSPFAQSIICQCVKEPQEVVIMLIFRVAAKVTNLGNEMESWRKPRNVPGPNHVDEEVKRNQTAAQAL